MFEKPDADKAPSILASIGHYVLTPDIFDILRNQPAGAGGEIQLADAINTQAAKDAVEAVTLNEHRFDCAVYKGTWMPSFMWLSLERADHLVRAVPALKYLSSIKLSFTELTIAVCSIASAQSQTPSVMCSKLNWFKQLL